jgi:hypothetical protein
MTDWTKTNLLPLADLEFWYQYEEGVSANNFINDYSSHNRDLSCASSGAPVLTADILNGEPAWRFDGTSNPLSVTSSFTVRHLFVIASADEATFAEFRGLISSPTTDWGLVGEISTSKFFDFSGSIIYRKDDVLFDPAEEMAPVSGKLALIEWLDPAGVAVDGIQIGQQINLSARKWKGYFVEAFGYSTEQNTLRRRMIYEYVAMRRHLWQRAEDGGPFVFPFPGGKTTGKERDRENYLSTPYDGPQKALVRGIYKDQLSIPFALRRQEEFDAAQAFFEQHSPIEPFIFRDYRFFPPRDTKVRFASSFREQGSDTSFRFNYGFDVVETANVVTVPDPGDVDIGMIPEGAVVDDDGAYLIDDDGAYLIDG